MVGAAGMAQRRARASEVAVENASTGEAQLLRLARAGDRTALEKLLTPHEQPLYVLCRGMLGHAEDAEDAVQETFLRALRSLPRFRGDASVRSWLFRIAVNICLDNKRIQRPTEPWNEDAIVGGSGPSAESTALHHLRLLEALASLSPRQRAILLLKEVEGWTAAEIAAAVGWSVKKVHNEQYRARVALADWQRREADEGEQR